MSERLPEKLTDKLLDQLNEIKRMKADTLQEIARLEVERAEIVQRGESVNKIGRDLFLTRETLTILIREEDECKKLLSKYVEKPE